MNGKITFLVIYMPVYIFCRFLPDSCEFRLSDRGSDKEQREIWHLFPSFANGHASHAHALR
jgi:hypothetical protein